jgi:hypothetical protein
MIDIFDIHFVTSTRSRKCFPVSGRCVSVCVRSSRYHVHNHGTLGPSMEHRFKMIFFQSLWIVLRFIIDFLVILVFIYRSISGSLDQVPLISICLCFWFDCPYSLCCSLFDSSSRSWSSSHVCLTHVSSTQLDSEVCEGTWRSSNWRTTSGQGYRTGLHRLHWTTDRTGPIFEEWDPSLDIHNSESQSLVVMSSDRQLQWPVFSRWSCVCHISETRRSVVPLHYRKAEKGGDVYVVY